MTWPVDDLTTVNMDADSDSPLLSRSEIIAAVNKIKSMLAPTNGTNIGIGTNSMQSITTGANNTAFGNGAFQAGTTGLNNSAFGYQSLNVNVSGIGNCAFGYQTLFVNNGGGQNSAFGVAALTGNTNGYRNSAFGNVAGTITTTGNNVTSLGYNANPPTATSGDTITLGDANVISLRCNVTSITALSDRRDKKNIVDLPVGLEFVNLLRPVKFDWARRDGTMQGITEAGFIAQDLDAAQVGAEYLGLVLHDNPEKLEASPSKLLPILVKAIQELSAKNASLEARLTDAGIA